MVQKSTSFFIYNNKEIIWQIQSELFLWCRLSRKLQIRVIMRCVCAFYPPYHFLWMHEIFCHEKFIKIKWLMTSIAGNGLKILLSIYTYPTRKRIHLTTCKLCSITEMTDARIMDMDLWFLAFICTNTLLSRSINLRDLFCLLVFFPLFWICFASLGFISRWGALAGRYAALCPPGWPWTHHRMPFHSPTHGK